MTTAKPGPGDLLRAFTARFVEEFLAETDAEVLEAAAAEHSEPELEAQRLRAMLTSTAIQHGKDRLAAARVSITEETRRDTLPRGQSRSLGEKQALLARLRAKHPGVTLAARKGVVESEDEIDSLLEDFAELGITDDGSADE